jgi:hypothetical protein
VFIVLEVLWLVLQGKSFHTRLRFEACGDTATRLPRGYRVALFLSLKDFARAQVARPLGSLFGSQFSAGVIRTLV